jgi:Ca2+-binding RTX toxin-like protein
MALDEYVYDPSEPSGSNMLYNAATGTFRMVTGKIAEANPEGVEVKTPLATIGIRGTGMDVVSNDEGLKVGIFAYHQFDVVITTAEGTTFLTDGDTIIEVFSDGTFSAPRPYSEVEKYEIETIAPITSVGLIPDEDQDDGGDEEQQGQGGEQEGEGEEQNEGEEGQDEEEGEEDVSNSFEALRTWLTEAETLSGFEGTETLIGSEQDDNLDGDDGADTGFFENVFDDDDLFDDDANGDDDDGSSYSPVFVGTESDDSYLGTGSDETISGLCGNDYLYGGAGNDCIIGGSGKDTLYGGAGDDTFVFYSGDAVSGEIVDGGSGDNVIQVVTNEADFSGCSMNGTFTDLILDPGQTAKFDADQVNGQSWKVQGGSGSDLQVTGNPGSELDLSGFDFSALGDGGLVLDLTGLDTVLLSEDNLPPSFSLTGSAISSSLTLKVFSSSGDPVDAGNLFDFGGGDEPTVVGVDENDPNSFMGSDGDDSITGNDEDNVIKGFAGNDTLEGDTGGDTLEAGADNDSVIGGQGDDVLEGGAGNDTLEAGDGADTLNGGAGDNSLLGSSGIDLVDYSDETDGMSFTLSGTTLVDHDGWMDTLTGIEGVIGSNNSSSGDSLVGGAAQDFFVGLAGDDTLQGENSHDTLDGGAGNDSLDGGSGDDSISGGDGDDNIDGGDGSDTIDGGAGDDTIQGGEGTFTQGGREDSLLGGDGFDYVSFEDHSIYGVDVSLDAAGDGTYSSANTIFKYFDFEGIIGSTYEDTLHGNDSDNVIYGLGGDSDSGYDSIYGGEGDDTLISGSSSYGDFMDGEGDDDLLIGGAGDDSLFGDAGNDTIQGGAGSDSLFGGEGAYSDWVDYSDKSSFVFIDLSSTVTVANGVDQENDTLAGFENAIGSSGGNQIIGSDANNYLIGNDGVDTLEGGLGNDSLEGGDSGDIFYFASKDDGVDKIMDFVSGVDSIVLSDNAFPYLTWQTGNAEYIRMDNYNGINSGENDSVYVFDTTTHDLYYDEDGDGGAGPYHLAHFDNDADVLETDVGVIA